MNAHSPWKLYDHISLQCYQSCAWSTIIPLLNTNNEISVHQMLEKKKYASYAISTTLLCKD
ncbi:hypothetical protein T01_4201 [Trichinella spiralis]|uniref:Uncharacterized protein n=1 Tax=Trichinella spiralis TaxID=6334 RepID=A0A0V1BVG4_TRISP|nr:hypothetical protein T01_4201 [Trichinella spiralis]